MTGWWWRDGSLGTGRSGLLQACHYDGRRRYFSSAGSGFALFLTPPPLCLRLSRHTPTVHSHFIVITIKSIAIHLSLVRGR